MEVGSHDAEYATLQARLFSDITAGRVQVTVVPRRDTYVNAARCLTILGFPPPQLAQSLQEELIPGFAAVEPCHHYYPAPTLHLTIKNLRAAASAPTFSAKEIRIAGEVLHRMAPELPQLEFTLNGVVRFPNSLAIRAFASRSFRDCVLRLDAALRHAGIVDDKTYASTAVLFGSITICRFTKVPSVALDELLTRFGNCELGRLRISTVHLVSCDEVCSAVSRQIHASASLGA